MQRFGLIGFVLCTMLVALVPSVSWASEGPVVNAAGGPPARIMGPFPGKPDLFGFYGHAWWPITVAWSRR